MSEQKKTWLIRTHTNHLLGPVSKNKIQELLKNDLLRPNDELCHGNSFWFFVKEEKYLKRYIEDDIIPPLWPCDEKPSEIENTQFITIPRNEEKNEKKEVEEDKNSFTLQEMPNLTPPPLKTQERPNNLEVKKKENFNIISYLIYAFVAVLALFAVIHKKILNNISFNPLSIIPLKASYALAPNNASSEVIKKKPLIFPLFKMQLV